jgi:hypothetical protein
LVTIGGPLSARRDRHDHLHATPEIAAKLAVVRDPRPDAAMVDTSSGPADALVEALALIGRTPSGTDIAEAAQELNVTCARGASASRGFVSG